MRKSKKTIAILAIIAMVLMMIPVQAFAADNTALARLSGATRVDTAIAIANSGWANGATNVVVVPANDENLVDALAVAPLAKQLNAPVLITDKAGLDASVSAEIATLKATNVYAVGALSDAVVSQLKALSGVTVTQIKGADRFATAAQIASMLTSPAGSVVVGYNGLADALSAASFAAANGYAILVANTDGTVPANEAAYEGSKVIELGGPTLVADIAGATRYYGSDRYATNDQVIKNLSFKYDKVYVANGETLVDALSGAVLAALTNSPIVLANTQGAAAAADVNKNLTASSQVIAFGGTAVVPDSVVTGVENGGTTTPAGPLAVQSVKAVAADQIQVTFNTAPADTSKVVFAVQNSGTDMTTTATWNDAKTVATLAYSANFPQGDYTVNVKNDTTDLGTSNLSITQEQVAKIEVTSTVLSVDPNAYDPNDSTSVGYGYATYKVLDQYGADVTDQPLGNNVTWTPGIGTLVSASNGVIIIKPYGSIPLTSYTSCVLNAYESTSYITTSSTLSISQATGTLSKITLNKLTSPNNDDFNSGNTTGQWFLDYTATDASGNPTDNYTLVSKGVSQISAPYLKTSVVQDSSDTTKADISVQLDPSSVNNLVADMQIPITVVLKNGQTSTINVTLKKAAALSSIILSAPTTTPTSNKNMTIPFVAYDQYGSVVTDYSKLHGLVTFTNSGGGTFDFVQNADGSATLKAVMPALASGVSTISVYLNATVSLTGKMSQLNLTVQKAAVPTTLSLDSTVLIPAMQLEAAQNIDFGYNYGGLSVKDQYGNSYDMNDVDGTQYKVVASTTGSVVTLAQNDSGGSVVVGGPNDIYDGYGVLITANQTGTQSVQFALEDLTSGTAKVLSTQSQTITVVDNSKISGYTMAAPSTLYAQMQHNTYGTATAVDKDYAAQLKVYGTLTNGNKVLLAPQFTNAAGNTLTTVVQSSSSSTDFLPLAKTGTYTTTTKTYVFANKYDLTTHPGKTSSSGTITVMVNGTDGILHTLTASVAATSDSPVAKSIDYYVDEIQGASSSSDTVTVAHGLVDGSLLTYSNSTTGAEPSSPVYFFADDQYGSQCAPVTVYIANATGTATAATVTNNVLSLNGATSGTITLTGVTNNGLAKSIILQLN